MLTNKKLRELFPQYRKEFEELAYTACGCAGCILNALSAKVKRNLWDELPDEYSGIICT